MSDYSSMFEGYDDVEASYGYDNEPLESGWYPLKVEKVLDTSLSKNGSPQARLQLLVTEGASENKRTFINISMGPAALDKAGAQRTADDLAKASKTIQAQMRGWLQSIGVTTGQPVGEGHEAVFSFFNVGSWEGREFMGFIKKLPATEQWGASNRLQSYRSPDDEKRGIAAWRAEQAGAAASGGEAQTI